MWVGLRRITRKGGGVGCEIGNKYRWTLFRREILIQVQMAGAMAFR